MNQTDSPEYLARKSAYDRLITVYGRKPVYEILADRSLEIFRLHLADSNRGGGIVEQIKSLAAQRNIEICYHSREQLARISRNSKQDQGVACDIHSAGYQPYKKALEKLPSADQRPLIALDGITNPQNLGMIIRSITASPAYGLLLPSKGCADISALVIKASAGTVFKGNILRCESLAKALPAFIEKGFEVCTLSSHQATPLAEFKPQAPIIYVLGNETEGVSKEIAALSKHRVGIPMANGVESLNVAITAALIAFSGL
ncbi:putative rRNA methylase [gamma proteobacterium HTCC2207]|jgi:23S rRNA (guanosine2251-2'-O)-methyltransferase|uniref:Putative rRNA methylase n=1 Tax=gamma proteobacterium HTCC2207 TaxID=314287 RepID=Q1YRT9_9GAMM|nr:putative rRNA methylase [gamma proteobacterium HTCC2207]